MKILGIRRLLPLVLAVPAVFVSPSCTTVRDDPYAWEENAFLQSRPPAYAYGGGQVPNTGRPYGAGNTVSPGDYQQSRGGTLYLPSTQPPRQPSTTSSPPLSNADTGWVPFWQRRGDGDSTGGSGTRSGGGAGSSGSTPDAGQTAGGGSISSETMITPPSLTQGGTSGGASTPKKDDKGHPYGIAVPGKYGYVYSPHDPEKRFVDVTDIPTGTEVRCPYTKKIFLVP